MKNTCREMIRLIISNAKMLLGDRFVAGMEVRINGDRIAELEWRWVAAMSAWTRVDACWRRATVTFIYMVTAATTRWTAQKPCLR